MGNTARTAWIAAAALAVVAAGCTSSGSDGADATEPAGPATTEAEVTTTTGPTLAWPEPTFVEGECPMPITNVVIVDVTCGTVDVPENRLDPDSGTISLAVARLSSLSPDPAADPVVQLQGGPGFPSLENLDNFAQSSILDDRDYILWDQRGTGFSTPNLDCTEANEAVWEIFSTADAGVDEGAIVEDALRACRDRITADGTDLDGYDTTQNAADLADLRLALGVDEWNLRGISYGSALAIETVRNHPEGLRSVLLDSVVPPNESFGAVARGESALRAFGELYDACAADEACSETYGDLEALFTEAADSLDAEPFTSTIVDPLTETERPIMITGKDMWAGLFNAMYDETLIPILPSAAQSIADGDNGLVSELANRGIPFAAGQHEGMTASVNCSGRQRLLDPDAVEPFVAEHPELDALVYLTVPEQGCAEWDVELQPEGFNELLTEDGTDVPIIVMAGRFDPITPPEGSEAVAEALGLELLLFPNAGHGAVSSSACARDIWFAFMDDPTQTPDTSCMDDLGPPEFT